MQEFPCESKPLLFAAKIKLKINKYATKYSISLLLIVLLFVCSVSWNCFFTKCSERWFLLRLIWTHFSNWAIIWKIFVSVSLPQFNQTIAKIWHKHFDSSGGGSVYLCICVFGIAVKLACKFYFNCSRTQLLWLPSQHTTIIVCTCGIFMRYTPQSFASLDVFGNFTFDMNISQMIQPYIKCTNNMANFK